MRARESRDPKRVAAMFGRIAKRYDLLNRLLSADLDRGWRRAAVLRLPPDPEGRVLDLCGGTGDLAVEVVRHARSHSVVCCDFSHPMLVLAAAKFARKETGDRCTVLEADALRLPFADGAFDGVTVGFGIRNLADLDAGLREIHRVLAPRGTLVVLEFSQPDGRWISRLYRLYLNRVLPLVGDGAGGGGGAYRYLARTIADFPDPARLADRVREAGFAACDWTMLTGGVVAIHTGVKEPVGDPDRASPPSSSSSSAFCA